MPINLDEINQIRDDTKREQAFMAYVVNELAALSDRVAKLEEPEELEELEEPEEPAQKKKK